MPTELMFGQKPIMPMGDNGLESREDLLAARIRQLERRPEDVE